MPDQPDQKLKEEIERRLQRQDDLAEKVEQVEERLSELKAILGEHVATTQSFLEGVAQARGYDPDEHYYSTAEGGFVPTDQSDQ